MDVRPSVFVPLFLPLLPLLNHKREKRKRRGSPNIVVCDASNTPSSDALQHAFHQAKRKRNLACMNANTLSPFSLQRRKKQHQDQRTFPLRRRRRRPKGWDHRIGDPVQDEIHILSSFVFSLLFPLFFLFLVCCGWREGWCIMIMKYC